MALELIHHTAWECDVDALRTRSIGNSSTAGSRGLPFEPLLQLLNKILKKRHDIGSILYQYSTNIAQTQSLRSPAATGRILAPLFGFSMRSLPLKLAPGSDLRLSLEQLGRSEGIHGFVLGVVGNLNRAAFQCPGQATPTVLEGDLEVITLNGTISPEGVHLHLSLSDGACQVWGGHLEEGTLVQKGVDLLVGVLEQTSSAEADQPRIELAVLPGCPWCARALRLLRTLDLPHTVITVNDDADFERCQARSGMRTFPQVFIDGAVIGGYDELSTLHASGELAQIR